MLHNTDQVRVTATVYVRFSYRKESKLLGLIPRSEIVWDDAEVNIGLDLDVLVADAYLICRRAQMSAEDDAVYRLDDSIANQLAISRPEVITELQRKHRDRIESVEQNPALLELEFSPHARWLLIKSLADMAAEFNYETRTSIRFLHDTLEPEITVESMIHNHGVRKRLLKALDTRTLGPQAISFGNRVPQWGISEVEAQFTTAYTEAWKTLNQTKGLAL